MYTPVTGAENAFPGKVIASATWNAIFTDIAAALTQLGQQLISEPTIKTTAGPFTITDETFYVLNKSIASATAIALPAVAARDNSPLVIVDWAGNAGDIVITPNGAETINGLATLTITSGGSLGTGGSVMLRPSADLSGWIAYS